MPIDTADIERLAQILQRSGVASIEIEEEGVSLRLVIEADEQTATTPAYAAQIKSTNESPIVAKADVAGIFVAAHPWRATPFVEPGQAIEAGAIVGLVKIGLVYVPVLSPAAGIVEAIVAETGATVGYGTPIVSVRAAA